jgi:DNA-binding phage protein
MENLNQIEQLINSVKIDLAKFETKKTASSATHARGSLLAIKKLCDTARKQILAETKLHKNKKQESTPTPETVSEEDEEVPVKKTRKKKVKVVA